MSFYAPIDNMNSYLILAYCLIKYVTNNFITV